MYLKTRHLVTTVLLLAALLVSACGQEGGARPPAGEATDTPVSAPAVTAAPATTAPPATTQPARTAPARATGTTLPPTPTRPVPTDTARAPATATWTPSETPLPSPSPTSYPTPTVTPPPAQAITPANAGRLALLERLGQGALQDMAWLPDGQTIVAAHYSGLSLYDGDTLEERQFIPGYGWKSGLAASPDGRQVAVITRDGVQLWDLVSGQAALVAAELSGGAKLVAWASDGESLAILASESKEGVSQDSVTVWDVSGEPHGGAEDSRLLLRIAGFSRRISSLALSPGGTVLVTSSERSYTDPNDTPLRFWDAQTGEPLPLGGDLPAAPGDLGHLLFSPDGHLLAGTDMFTIGLWDASSGDQVGLLETPAWVEALAFSGDGRFLAAALSDQTVSVYEVDSGRQVGVLAGFTDEPMRVAFDPAFSPGTGEPLLATGTPRDGVQLWEVSSGRRVATHPQAGPTDGVTAIAYSPDGRLLAAAGADETVWFWDTGTGQPVGKLDAAGMSTGIWCACFWSLAFSPDGKTIATGSTDAVVRLWDVESRALVDLSEAPEGLVYSLAFSPDGRRLAAGDAGGKLWLWDVAAPLGAGPLLALDNPPTVLSISFNPESAGGGLVATGSGFGVIRLWDVGTGELVREMRGSDNSAIALYRPDGGILASGSGGFGPDYAVRLWDPRTGELRRTLEGHTTDVKELAFSPDGRLLASCDWDGRTRLWDTTTGTELRTLEQGWGLESVVFSPDASRLVTGGSDGLLWIWAVP